MSVVCPYTLALSISACGISYVEESRILASGRSFSEDELYIRNCVELAPRVRCPVLLIHGTADETVGDHHSRELESALEAGGVEMTSKYYEGGLHFLSPVTTRRDTTVELADALLREVRRPEEDDFLQRSQVKISCVTKQLVIDWSREPDDY